MLKKSPKSFEILKFFPWSLTLASKPGPEVIKPFSYSTQLSTKIILLINIKMPTIVGILTFISMIITTSERLIERIFFTFWYLSFYEQLKSRAQMSLVWKKFYNLWAWSWKMQIAKAQIRLHTCPIWSAMFLLYPKKRYSIKLLIASSNFLAYLCSRGKRLSKTLKTETHIMTPTKIHK